MVDEESMLVERACKVFFSNGKRSFLGERVVAFRMCGTGVGDALGVIGE